MIILKSHAKINLTLEIKGLRRDGYHEIETVMQNISLSDEILLSAIDKGVEISCSDPSVPSDERNICSKAARLIQESRNIDTGVRIVINKNIPSGAGLGGGSSNAAAVLAGLDKMWALGLTRAQLLKYAARLGSDVPFFIVGGTGVCRGRGEKIQNSRLPKPERLSDGGQAKFKIQNGGRYIIVKPDISVSTKWAYEEWDRKQAGAEVGSEKREYFNDFQDIVVSKYPEIQKAIDELRTAGCDVAQLSGSGSAVFGTVSEDKAQKVFDRIKQTHEKTFLVEAVNAGFEFIE